MNEQKLAFGWNDAVPSWALAAWGARLIYPDDLVHNRQSAFGSDADKNLLIDWLNGGAIRGALTHARELDKSRRMTPRDIRLITLYEDEQGIIVGNPNRSGGYLYVAGWFKQQGAKV